MDAFTMATIIEISLLAGFIVAAIRIGIVRKNDDSPIYIVFDIIVWSGTVMVATALALNLVALRMIAIMS